MKNLLPAFQHISEYKTPHQLRKTAILSCLLVALCISSAYADETPDIHRLMQAGQYAEALKKTNAVLAKHPDDAQLRFIKGLILAEQNKSAEAIVIFTKLTEDFPDLPEPYNNLAVLYAARGEYDKARATLDLAIRTNPVYATALQNLGDVYAKMASQAYDKALQLEPDNKAPQPRLVLVQSLQGNMTGGTIPQQGMIRRPASASAPTPAVAPVDKPTRVAIATPAKAPDINVPEVKVAPAPADKPAPVVALTPLPTPAPVATPAPAQKPAAVTPPPAAVATAPKAPEVKAPTPKPADKPAQVAAATPAKAPEVKAPEAKPVAKAEDKPAKADNKQAEAIILAAVHGWAKAWTDQNVKAYLGYYADNFKTPAGVSRKAWAEERRARIEDKGHIDVKVNGPTVRIDGNTATVRFRQGYTSNRLTVTSRKTLTLEKNGNKWLIVQEIAGR